MATSPQILQERTGRYAISGGGIRQFLPRPLPPNPPLRLDKTLVLALSRADRALARLDGMASVLPNPDWFVYGFMRQEALLSSQIEGTEASLEEVLAYEAAPSGIAMTDDIGEVINYIEAMKWGLQQLDKLPVSLRLIRGLHHRLLKTGRGSDRRPGEFRQMQNWIGAARGAPIEEAIFVPPPPAPMVEALEAWERFIHEGEPTPPLVKCALVHAQFETIHPFLNGNGRLGRMIITFLLCSEKVLQHPILYLSLFFKRHRDEYYERLQAIRDRGDWEQWVLFFLRGVAETSDAAVASAQKIIKLRERVQLAAQRDMRGAKASALAFILFQSPYLTTTMAASTLATTFPTAGKLIDQFEAQGFLAKVPGRRRGRLYAFRPYLDILRDSELALSAAPTK